MMNKNVQYISNLKYAGHIDIDLVAEVVDGKEWYAILAECKFRNRKTGTSA